jgi:hypothetical protein
MEPARTIATGIFALTTAARVMMAGVGCPSGSIGKQSTAVDRPKRITSASAGDVSGNTSAFAPAAESPGSAAKSVLLMKRKNILNTSLFFNRNFRHPLVFFVEGFRI